MRGCKFCGGVLFKQGVAFEDRYCYVVPAGYPRAYGHLLLVSKKHFGDMANLDKKTLCDCFYAARRFLPIMKKRLRAQGIYVIVDSEGAEEVYHFHIHLLPNYKVNHRKRPSYLSHRKLSDEDRAKLVRLLKLR